MERIKLLRICSNFVISPLINSVTLIHFLIKTFFSFQKTLPVLSTYVRNISADSTSLKDVLAAKIPQEIENVKAFRKSHGSTKVGEVTVDMVSEIQYCLS